MVAPPPADPHASSVSAVLTELCGEAVRSEPAGDLYCGYPSRHILGVGELKMKPLSCFVFMDTSKFFGSNMGVMIHNNYQRDRS